MSTLTITEFLEARIAEDEREANVCLDQYRRGEGGTRRRWTRQLAECAAKRAIIASMPPKPTDPYTPTWYYEARPILHHLAAVYADHPDYRQEWAL